MPSQSPWRLELSGSAGLSKYATQSALGHLLGGVRVHFLGANGGGWIGLTTGASFDRTSRSPIELSLAAWHAYRQLTLVGSVTATTVGADRYVDVLGAIRWSSDRVELEARAGARPAAKSSGGVGDPEVGGYAEASALFSLGSRVGFTVSAGKYPSDPVRRVLAANYLTAGLRLRVGRVVTAPVRSIIETRPAAPTGSRSDGSLTRIEVATSGSARVLRIRVANARSVEVMGDLTDWEPVKLERVANDVWEAPLQLEPGVYRVNVRVDGGDWTAPGGTRIETNDFGGTAGILVVP